MHSKLEIIAHKHFLDGNFKEAKNIYSDIGMPVEHAYCEIYLGNLEKAKSIINNLPKDSPIEEWLESFVQMIDLDLKKLPTFLQIRNFFEIDLSNLFLSCRKEYTENVINIVPSLVTINPEVFKLTARVLKDNQQEKLAYNFLRESLNICFFDSETHFLMAEICIKYGEKESAIKHLKYACQKAEYYPALKLLSKLNDNY